MVSSDYLDQDFSHHPLGNHRLIPIALEESRSEQLIHFCACLLVGLVEHRGSRIRGYEVEDFDTNHMGNIQL